MRVGGNDQVRGFFDRIANGYAEARYGAEAAPWRARFFGARLRLATELLGPESGRVLDLGAGPGVLAEALGDTPADVISLDLSAEMVRHAGQRSPRVLAGSSLELPFPDESFDTIVARSLLHHLPDVDKGISEMARVLRPGGEVVTVDTNRSLVSTLPRKLFGKGEHFSEDHQNLDRKELVEHFAKHGDLVGRKGRRLEGGGILALRESPRVGGELSQRAGDGPCTDEHDQ